MDSSDLDAIRAKRLAELSAGGGGGGGNTPTFPRGAAPGGGGGGAGGEDAAQKRAQEAEGRRTIMSQILSPEARERLSRIALVRPQRAEGIEDLLMRMAKGGQLRGRVTEEQLIGVLDQVEANERGPGKAEDKSSGKIVFSRKNRAMDSDDDFDL